MSEVVLIPGPEALVAPGWVPWEQRIRPGDLGVGDLLPAPEDDPRLVPGYVASDDPAVEEVAREIGLGRERVLSRDRPRAGGRAVAGRSARAGLRHGPLRARHVRHLRVLPAARGLAAGRRSACAATRTRPPTARSSRSGSAAGRTRTSASEATSPVAVAELVYDDGVDLEPAE